LPDRRSYRYRIDSICELVTCVGFLIAQTTRISGLGRTLVKLAISIAAGIVMAVSVIAVGSRLYMEAELRAATEAMAKLNADAARMQAQRDAELVGQRVKAEALVQDNAAKAQAQTNLATQKNTIRKN
jgi:hypothetical protein